MAFLCALCAVFDDPNVALTMRWMGVLATLFLGFHVFAWVFRYFVRPRTSLRKYVGPGKWAVVTGASDGIGAGFARQLARSGANVLLISRTQSKLDQLAEQIRGKYKVQAEVCAVDFGAPNDQIYPTVQAALAGKQVTILVNNVGITSDIATNFGEMKIEEIERQVHVNIDSMLRMTHAVLPVMVDNKCGAVFNLSSYSARFPLPMFATYAATKAFADNLTVALSQEYKNSGIIFQSIRPGYVASSMIRMRPSLLVATPDRIAADALGALGVAPSVSPYWPHALYEFVSSLMPVRTLLGIVHKKMLFARKRALAKLKQQ